MVAVLSCKLGKLNKCTKTHKRKMRLFLLFGLCSVWFVVVTWRLSSIQITSHSQWKDWARRQHSTAYVVASERGPIFDRNGKLLAVSVPAQSVYVRPREVRSPDAVIKLVQKHLGLEKQAIEEKLDSSSPFVWIKRQVPRVDAQAFMNTKLKGLGTLEEPRRFYPYKSAGSSLIGRVGIDGQGLSGIEAAYQKHLQGTAVKTRLARDALGNMRADVRFDIDSFSLPKGEALRLSLDADLQVILNQALVTGMENAKSKRALGILVNAESGEILAMDQVPTKNFNWQSIKSKQDLKNHIVESVFEPGSTMKPFVTALALEAGVTNTQEVIPCENGAYRFQRRIINDVHPFDKLSVRDIVVRSSNIGMTKIGARLGSGRLYNGLLRLGFGQRIALGLSGETAGILRHPKNWSGVDVATHSFGQGVAVTPLQLVRAMSAIANGGRLPHLSLVQSESSTVSEQVIRKRTATAIQDILVAVVEDEHGTGKRAKIEGVRVGGKTGTAQKAKINGRGYEEGAYIASFLGFADASNKGIDTPLVLLVAIDEPRGDSIYGGTLAGPVFHEVISKSINHLNRKKYLLKHKKRFDRPRSGLELRQVVYRGI